MPITKSAKKAHRQAVKRNLKNQKNKNDIKRVIKEFERVVKAKKLDEAKAKYSQVQKVLDKNVKRGLIKSNTASRKKSRLALALKK